MTVRLYYTEYFFTLAHCTRQWTRNIKTMKSNFQTLTTSLCDLGLVTNSSWLRGSSSSKPPELSLDEAGLRTGKEPHFSPHPACALKMTFYDVSNSFCFQQIISPLLNPSPLPPASLRMEVQPASSTLTEATQCQLLSHGISVLSRLPPLACLIDWLS